MVKFDGKHWIGKKFYNEPIEVHSYKHVANRTSDALGKDGVVAIPNARPDDRRYEEVFRMAESGAVIEPIEDGRTFYDVSRQVYFTKAQEVNTQLDGLPLTILVYNLPFDRNLDDSSARQVFDDAHDLGCIVGINGPSCIGSLEEALRKNPDLLGNLDFFVGYSGSATIKRGSNGRSIDFYGRLINNELFENPYDDKDIHKIGVTAVSGGHRTPKKWHEYLRSGFKQTIGSSYTEIPYLSTDNFMDDLRRHLHNSRLEDMHMKPIVAEMVLKHIPSMMIGDKFRKRSK